MSLVWEPNPNNKHRLGRVIPFVFQEGSEATADRQTAPEHEAAATNQKVADAAAAEKRGQILPVRY